MKVLLTRAFGPPAGHGSSNGRPVPLFGQVQQPKPPGHCAGHALAGRLGRSQQMAADPDLPWCHVQVGRDDVADLLAGQCQSAVQDVDGN